MNEVVFVCFIVVCVMAGGTIRGCVKQQDLETVCTHYTTTPVAYKKCLDGDVAGEGK